MAARNARHFRRTGCGKPSLCLSPHRSDQNCQPELAAATLKKLAARRYGREVECTALEVRHERKPVKVPITYPYDKLCLPSALRLPYPAASAFFNASMK
jgi:hypothetical protein